MKTVLYKDYDKNLSKVEYKKELSFNDFQEIVDDATNTIAKLIEDGHYGSIDFMIDYTIVLGCTDISFAGADLNDIWNFLYTTNVLSNVKESIGESVYNSIVSQIHTALNYALSTNPETKGLIKALTELILKFSKTDISKNGIADLKELAGMLQNITGKFE